MLIPTGPAGGGWPEVTEEWVGTTTCPFSDHSLPFSVGSSPRGRAWAVATQEGTSSQIVDPQASFLEAPNSSSLQVRNGRVSSGVAGEEAAPSPPPTNLWY